MSNVKLMKGHTFKSCAASVKYPVIVEYKYDEVRCDVVRSPVTGTVEFLSFAGNKLNNLDSFLRLFEISMAAQGIDRLDMGVIVNRHSPDCFNDTYRWVRSSKGIPKGLEKAQIEFVLFDVPACPHVFDYRVRVLDDMAICMQLEGISVIRPYRTIVHDEDSVYERYGEAISTGHEGLMVKSLDHTYALGKRTSGWLKVKPEDDASGKITEVHQARSIYGEPLNRAGSVTIVMKDGSTADAGNIKHGLGEQMWDNPDAFIGEEAEFTYMMRDRQGGYRHPRFKRIREA